MSATDNPPATHGRPHPRSNTVPGSSLVESTEARNNQNKDFHFHVVHPPRIKGKPRGRIKPTKVVGTKLTCGPKIVLEAENWSQMEEVVGHQTYRDGRGTIQPGDFVYIRADPTENVDTEALGGAWVGQVNGFYQKSREWGGTGEDPSYLRIHWWYRPRDLLDGIHKGHEIRGPYRGRNELIASNHLDIVDSETVESKAKLFHWDESRDDLMEQNIRKAQHSLFWRQELDFPKGNVNDHKNAKFSPLRKYCVDDKPCNPDDDLIQCPSCKIWLHERCIEAAAEKELTHLLPKSTTGKKRKRGPSSPSVTAVIKRTRDGYHPRLFITTTSGIGRNPQRNIKCLACEVVISGVGHPAEDLIDIDDEGSLVDDSDEEELESHAEDSPHRAMAVESGGEEDGEHTFETPERSMSSGYARSREDLGETTLEDSESGIDPCLGHPNPWAERDPYDVPSTPGSAARPRPLPVGRPSTSSAAQLAAESAYRTPSSKDSHLYYPGSSQPNPSDQIGPTPLRGRLPTPFRGVRENISEFERVTQILSRGGRTRLPSRHTR
ncbi:hypothetical protein SLS60_005570 [Paraconiothyrium brasiliense]|uniref:BAH domain-containing protein n=1 Tax=Paraconiothyrium brasiliense TaxID=300254 RepID=A0ABR3RI56_9PLEO